MLELDGGPLAPESVLAVAEGQDTVGIAAAAWPRVDAARTAIEGVLARGDTVYGVNTGFGQLAQVRVPAEDLLALQRNLVRSHACGLGDAMHPEDVLAMMLMRANSLAKGHSGTRRDVLELLIACVNAGIAPIVPHVGSLGASGDLAPLAHMAVGLIGEGDAWVRDPGTAPSGHARPTTSHVPEGWTASTMAEALDAAGLQPIVLEAKEGLSLINGTSQMLAWLVRAERFTGRLLAAADAILALSMEGREASVDPFDARLHAARPHTGQAHVAASIRRHMRDSAVLLSHAECDRVQDPYSFRCAPQVHGAVWETFWRLQQVLEVESGSATDNPLVFPDPANPGPHEVISGGNFHGEILAQVADAMAIALNSLGTISERRSNQLLDGDKSRLPPFLARHPGLESGLMIAQYVAAGALAEMQQQAASNTLFNVPVSAEQEDHVSMGATACGSLLRTVHWLAKVLAVEALCAAEALEHAQVEPGEGVRRTREVVRRYAAALSEDRVLADDIERVAAALLRGELGAS